MSEDAQFEDEEIREEEYTVQTDWVKCPVCDEVVNVKGKFVHFKNKHMDLPWGEYKDKFIPAPPPKRAVKKSEHVYKDEADANQILEDILSRHPNISDSVKEEVMDWARLKGFLQPMEVQAILQSMKGVSPSTANLIASKYAFALMKAQTEGRLLSAPIMVPQVQQQMPIPMQPQFAPQLQPPSLQPPSLQTPPLQPQPLQPPIIQSIQPQFQQAQQISEEKIRYIIRDEIARLTSTTTKEEYVEIEEPLRGPDGNVLLGPDDKPIVKRMRVPISQVDKIKTEDEELKLINKLKLYQEVIGGSKMSAEDIRRIIRDEMSRKEESISKQDIANIVSEITSKQIQQFVQEHLKVEKEEERWNSIIESIKEGFDKLYSELSKAKAVEGYQDDAIRLLAQGLSEVASTIRDRRPIELIVKEAPKWLLQQPPEITGKVGEPKIADLVPKELVE